MIKYDIASLSDSVVKERVDEDMSNVFSGVNRIENIIKSMKEVSEISSEKKEKTNIYHTLITSLTILYNTSKIISRIYINEKE